MRAAPITRGKLNSWCVWSVGCKTIKRQFGPQNLVAQITREQISGSEFHFSHFVLGHWISGNFLGISDRIQFIYVVLL